MSNDLRPLDIVGDIHGAFGRLCRLMDTLGYEVRHARWMHPEGRRLLFLGDYIDRGPNSFAVYRMVRKMVDDGIAIALMGNHELNAIAFSTRENDGVIDARQAHHDACAALATGRPSRGWQRRHELEAMKDGRRTLIARGRELANELARVDRETSAVLGIPRVWPDQLPTTFGPPDVAPLHGVAPAFVGSVHNDLDMGVDFGVESPVPLDPKISDRIRAMEIPRSANAGALNAAIRAREGLGLPNPSLRRDTDG